MKSLHLSPSGALKKGWELTKKHFIVMLGLVLGYMVLSWVVSLLGGADTTTFRYWILYLVNLVLSVWVSAGFAKILLDAYDGEEPSFSVFKELFPKLGGLIGVNVIVAVCYCIPLVLGFIVLFIGAGASAVSFNLADPYSFGHYGTGIQRSDGYSVFGAVFGVSLYCFAADVRRLCLRRRFFYRGHGCGS